MANAWLTQVTEQRSNLWSKAKARLDRATAEGRELTAAEEAQHSEDVANLESMRQAIEHCHQRDGLNRTSEASLRALADLPRNGRLMPRDENGFGEQVRQAVLSNSLAPIESHPTELRSYYSPGVEQRTLTESGLVGTTFANTLVRHIVNNSAILAAGATLIQTETGEPLRVPKTLSNSVPTITAEGALIPTSDPTLGTAALGAYKYAFLTSITNEMARDQSFNVESYLAEQAGLGLANKAGADFVAGSGAGQPAGIVGAATAGVTGATGVGGAPSADNLIDLLHSIPEPASRQPAAGWLMNNQTLAAVRKLKDSTGKYLFDLDVPFQGASGTLLGRPVYADAAVPAIGLGAKSVVYGDLSRYWIRAVGGVRFERSMDYGFGNDVVWYRAVWSADGVLVDQTGSVKCFAGGAS